MHLRSFSKIRKDEVTTKRVTRATCGTGIARW